MSHLLSQSPSKKNLDHAFPPFALGLPSVYERAGFDVNKSRSRSSSRSNSRTTSLAGSHQSNTGSQFGSKTSLASAFTNRSGGSSVRSQSPAVSNRGSTNEPIQKRGSLPVSVNSAQSYTSHVNSPTSTMRSDSQYEWGNSSSSFSRDSSGPESLADFKQSNAPYFNNATPELHEKPLQQFDIQKNAISDSDSEILSDKGSEHDVSHHLETKEGSLREEVPKNEENSANCDASAKDSHSNYPQKNVEFDLDENFSDSNSEYSDSISFTMEGDDFVNPLQRVRDMSSTQNINNLNNSSSSLNTPHSDADLPVPVQKKHSSWVSEEDTPVIPPKSPIRRPSAPINVPPLPALPQAATNAVPQFLNKAVSQGTSAADAVLPHVLPIPPSHSKQRVHAMPSILDVSKRASTMHLGKHQSIASISSSIYSRQSAVPQSASELQFPDYESSISESNSRLNSSHSSQTSSWDSDIRNSKPVFSYEQSNGSSESNLKKESTPAGQESKQPAHEYHLSQLHAGSQDETSQREALSENTHPLPPTPSLTVRKARKQCRGCMLPIKGKSIRSSDNTLSGRWHHSCFNCYLCADPLSLTEKAHVLNDMPYCMSCYHTLNNSSCRKCGEGIEGTCLETRLEGGSEPLRYHKSCLGCIVCKEPLKEIYFEADGDTYCAEHAFSSLPKTSVKHRRFTQLVSA